ncbi:MAG TPA: YihY/virulence factor BrkB family protein [Desulfosporosinus sp.]|nr:YihY/virulence factor BrkB family protein [Desulfosporosinus sp.]
MLEKLRDWIIYRTIKQLIFRYKEADLPSMSAQITYYLILAFFPFLLFLINLLSFTPLSSELLITNFNAFLPHDTAILVKNMLVQTVQAKSTTLLILGMLGSLWAASKGVSAIRKGLNNSYEVKESRHFVHLSFIALISTLGVTVMIIFTIVMLVFGKIIGSYVFGLIGATHLFEIIWSFLRYGIPLSLMFMTFSLIYKYVPNRRLKFKNIMVGTIFATGGWITTSLLFSFYVNTFANYEKVYGSLGGVIALISWLYISALIILLGGELNAISSNGEQEKFNRL